MKPKLRFLWTALVLAQMGSAQISKSVLPVLDWNARGATPRAEIPFKLYRGYLIVVQGSLGALEGLNFLIDTGVNPTAVDSKIANKLRLTGPTHKLALFNQNTDVGQVVLPSLQIGPIRAESLPGMIQDLSPLEEAVGARIDAQVGFGVLSRSSFSIDYRLKKIVFGLIESSPFSVPFDTGPPVITVQLWVHDEPIRVLVDTGSAELVLFECQLHGHLRQLPVTGGVRRFLNGAGKRSGLTEIWLPGCVWLQLISGFKKVSQRMATLTAAGHLMGYLGLRGWG